MWMSAICQESLPSAQAEGLVLPTRARHKISRHFADMGNPDRLAQEWHGLGTQHLQRNHRKYGGTIRFYTHKGLGANIYFTLSRDLGAIPYRNLPIENCGTS